MIENEIIPSACINGNIFNNNDEVVVNNNYQLKFPFSIKSVDPIVNRSLLADFTGKSAVGVETYSQVLSFIIFVN